MKMKKIVLGAMLVTGCGPCSGTSPDIQCWYASPVHRSCAAPVISIRGRTGRWWTDVDGPIFETRQELDQFVAGHGLILCGTER